MKLNREPWFRTVTIERDNGKTTETITYEPNGKLDGKIVVRSNDEGTEITFTEYDANDAIRMVGLIKHILDSYGNWVVNDTFLEEPKDGSKRLIQTTRRTITYY